MLGALVSPLLAVLPALAQAVPPASLGALAATTLPAFFGSAAGGYGAVLVHGPKWTRDALEECRRTCPGFQHAHAHTRPPTEPAP